MKRLKTVPLLLFMHFYFMQQGGMCTLASELLVRAMCPIQFSFLQFDADADTYYSDTNRYLQVHSAFKSYCGGGTIVVRSGYMFHYKHISNENIIHSLLDRKLDWTLIASKRKATTQMDR